MGLFLKSQNRGKSSRRKGKKKGREGKSKKEGKRRAWEYALPKRKQFGSYGCTFWEKKFSKPLLILGKFWSGA